MPVPTDELTRLSTGAPTGYNNAPFNASTNPYGFADGGYITNFFAALGDMVTVTTWTVDEIAPIVALAVEIDALGSIVPELQTIAGVAPDIQALAALDTQLTALGAITGAITTVAASSAAVVAVATDIAKVAAVQAKLPEIELVANDLGNITAVLAMSSDIDIVVTRAADIAVLADIEDGTEATNAIQTVAAIATAVSNVSTNSANVVALAGDLADINTLAGIASSISALGPIASDIAAVADIGSDVEAAADNIAAIVAAPAAAEAARKSVRHIIFDSGTADAHPGSGHFRLSFDINAATVGQTGFIYHDVTDADLGTITEWIESWDDVINATGRGNISLVGEADPSISMMLRVTGAVTNGTSYRKIPVTLLQKSVVGGSFADEMEFSETFQANGNDAGGGAGTGDVVSTGSITSGNLVRYADGSGDVIEDSGKAIAAFFDKTADTLDNVPDGSTYVRAMPAELSKLSGIEAAADVTDAGNVGAAIAGSSNKSTPVSPDRFALLDSANSNALAYATFAQVLAGFQTSFDSRYSQLGHTHSWVSLTSKPTTVSGAGLTDAATLAGSETLTNKTLVSPVLTLEQGASVAPTVEGRIAWDTDDNKLKIGDGSGTKTFSDDSVNAATYVSGSVGSVDNRLVRSNGTGGLAVQGSGITVDDSDNLLSATGLVLGHSAKVGTEHNTSAAVPSLQSLATGSAASMMAGRFSNDAFCGRFYLLKSRGANVGTFATTQSGDDLGAISFAGSDNATALHGATIQVVQNGAVGANFVPARIELRTSDGSANPDVRLAAGGGIYHPSATGGDKGDNTINFGAVYDDSSLLTCMAMAREFIDRGEVDLAKWDALVPDMIEPAREIDVPVLVEQLVKVEGYVDERNEDGALVRRRTSEWRLAEVPAVEVEPVWDERGKGVDVVETPIMEPVVIAEVRVVREHRTARIFKAMLDAGFDPRDPERYFSKMRDDEALPGMPSQRDWEHNGLSIGEQFSRKWLAMEMLAIVANVMWAKLKEHEGRIAALEANG